MLIGTAKIVFFMKKNIFISIIMVILNYNFSFANQGNNLDFKSFTNGQDFISINKDRLNLKYSNCKTHKNNGNISYKEIKLLLNEDEVLDINKHYDFLNDYQSKNFTLPFYSISIWAWYKTVAFKTKNVNYFSNFEQVTKRRNMVVPKELIRDILKFNVLNIYLHQGKHSKNNNKKYFGKFTINKKDNPSKCFNIN